MSAIADELHARLETLRRRHTLRRGIWGGTTSIIHGGGVIAGGVAGVGGLSGLIGDPQIVGLLAAIPAAVSIVGPRLKCAEVVSWHAEYVAKLDDLSARLAFLEADPAADGSVQTLVQEFLELNRAMEAERKRTLSKPWDLGALAGVRA